MNDDTAEARQSRLNPGKRDPRADPHPGDVTRTDVYREVTRRDEATVTYTVGRIGYEMPLEVWREVNRNAEVIHVAD